jgi:response regulator NasT
LREIGDAVIVRVVGAGSLVDAVRSTAPGVIIVDMARHDGEALDDLRRINADDPRPIVMFVDRDDRAFVEAAIAADLLSAASPEGLPK